MLEVSRAMRHPRPESIRLKAFHRYLLYAVLTLLFLSGVVWAYVNYLVSLPSESELAVKSLSIKAHGAAAMATLVLIGTVLTAHVKFAWRAGRNRANGTLFLSAFGILTVTGYGLYYAGDERLRAWTGWIHLGVGLALPLLLLIHILLGKKTRSVIQPRKHQSPQRVPAKIDI
jgi:magnesium-transporting ATPase (P-type)